MKTFYLLVMLTQNGAGDINASFVNTETLQQCQQKAQMVEAVFITAEIPVLENRCVESEQKFSEFDHASAASHIRHFYLIISSRTAIQINPVPDWQSCIDKRREASSKNFAADAGVYCVSSVQSVE